MTALAAALAFAMPAHAGNGVDNYPSRPIRMIVPLSPGTTTDVVARTIGDHLSRELEQPVIVENKQGAGGTLAAKVTAMGRFRRLHDHDGQLAALHQPGGLPEPAL
jgi:tripartite-type tricarboxylate transporter receptor subunit TctC